MIGSLIIDKPEGMTSHDVVARVRRAAATRRVGHAGTLDPFATGVLVVCIGSATRLVQFLVGLDKEYTATVRLGYATDTQDLTGKPITPLQSSNEVSLDNVISVLNDFTGAQLQMPPMFSAKKIAGERLYRAARKGREVERPALPITVYSIELQSLFDMGEDGARDFVIRVRSSSGTYVRTIAHDIGAKLGVGAHLRALRRTAVGHFKLERALTLDELEFKGREGGIEGLLTSPSDTLAHLPLARLDEDGVRRVMNGREVQPPVEGVDLNQSDQLPVRLCDKSGELVAVGDYDSRLEVIKPRVVLAAVN
ncbi:MAG TPA: tRNA pseudouridine(55) synthase TruB [Blastocatellia bacterium]|nr:tRNA pseudouridine(55) synthase TruB [Blastocatellia bacterium]